LKEGLRKIICCWNCFLRRKQFYGRVQNWSCGLCSSVWGDELP